MNPQSLLQSRPAQLAARYLGGLLVAHGLLTAGQSASLTAIVAQVLVGLALTAFDHLAHSKRFGPLVQKAAAAAPSIFGKLPAVLLLLTFSAAVALAAGGCKSATTPAATTQPSALSGLPAQLKAVAVSELGVAESDASQFVEQWAPQWISAGLQSLEAQASGDQAAKDAAARHLKQLQADTLQAAKGLGAGVGEDAAAKVVSGFVKAFAGGQ